MGRQITKVLRALKNKNNGQVDTEVIQRLEESMKMVKIMDKKHEKWM